MSNGIPTPDMSPDELAPTAQEQLQWPMWGQYYEQDRKGGEPPALARRAGAGARSSTHGAIGETPTSARRSGCGCSTINADQVYTIGIVTRALQPVVVRDNLRNVPAEGIYSWDPGAYFGMYHPDTFWFDRRARGVR